MEEQEADDGALPLLVARPVAVERTADMQLKNYVDARPHDFTYWKLGPKHLLSSIPGLLQEQLTDMLPALLGARDFVGAGQVLSVLYQRFTITPAMCAQVSLEVLRRQPGMMHELNAFYRVIIDEQRLDRLTMLKELWTLHIISGDFYEAYYLYQDEMRALDISDDHRLLANFGALCYWLLIIESSEVREKLRKEEEEEEAEEMEEDDMDGMMRPKVEDIESLIQSKYAFKSPIGVSVLYQNATNALRRAVGLSPNSAIFLEYYVQLLILVGNIETACDYLENFYHAHPDDPHSARMLVGFLEKYYPSSPKEQARIYIKWIRNDPAAMYPVNRLMDLYREGSVSARVIVEVVGLSLDTCGGDLYFVQSPTVSMELWKNFAEAIVAMDEEELVRAFKVEEEEDGNEEMSKPLSSSNFLSDFGYHRRWWMRTYFAKPRSIEEVTRTATTTPDLVDIWIFRAAVADRMFSNVSPSMEILRKAMAEPVDGITQNHLRLYKSFFGVKPEITESSSEPTVMPITLELPDTVSEIQRSSMLPVMTGDPLITRLIPRSAVIKDTQHAKLTKVSVRTNKDAGEMDAALIAALENAMKPEVFERMDTFEQKMEAWEKEDKDRLTEHPIRLPAYVRMIEEATYCNRKVSTKHLYSVIHRELAPAGGYLPTVAEVDATRKFFAARWRHNYRQYGHHGMLTRYENFLKHEIAVAIHHGRNEFSVEFIDDLLAKMKRELPSSHMHFPERDAIVAEFDQLVKTVYRLRRKKRFEIKNAMRGLAQTVIEVKFDDMVETGWAVCRKNNLDIFVTRDDIWNFTYSILTTHYIKYFRSMNGRSRVVLFQKRYAGYTDPNLLYRAIRQSNYWAPMRLSPFQAYVKLWLDRHYKKKDVEVAADRSRRLAIMKRRHAREKERKRDRENKQKRLNGAAAAGDGGRKDNADEKAKTNDAAGSDNGSDRSETERTGDQVPSNENATAPAHSGVKRKRTIETGNSEPRQGTK